MQTSIGMRESQACGINYPIALPSSGSLQEEPDDPDFHKHGKELEDASKKPPISLQRFVGVLIPSMKMRGASSSGRGCWSIEKIR